MDFNKFDFLNSEEDPAQLTQEFSVHTMANVIVAHSNVDEAVAVITAWYCLHRYPLMPLSLYHSHLPYRQSDPQAKYHQQRKRHFKKRLMLQRALGGEIGDISALTLEDSGLSIEFNFPVHNFLERLADHYNMPVEQMKQTFRKQLEEAYSELIETGEGELKDFGILHQGNGGPTDLIFDIKEELKVILSSDVETSRDIDGND